jgi:glycine/D-amino acid oxidase-like deaminating enzyme
VTIYEASPVTRFSKEGSGDFLVETAQGVIRADYLVIATNAYSVLFPQLRALQKPAFTHIVLTEPLSPEQLDSIGWGCRAGVEDARDLIHYYRLTHDNRIAMGKGLEQAADNVDRVDPLPADVFGPIKQAMCETVAEKTRLLFADGKAWT